MGRKRGFDELVVLATVRDQFWTTGYEGTSTYDLMDVTGLGKGSIYKAFGNKHDLYMRVFSDYCQDLVSQAGEALGNGSAAQSPSPLARLERYLVSLAEQFGAESPHRGCFLTKATVDLAGLDKEVADRARLTYDDIATVFAATIRDAQEAGEVDSKADSRTLGYLLLTVIRGIDCLAKADVDSATLTKTARGAIGMLPKPA
jgi:TetR/AcrR family transcriptional repressor of nem operon